MLNPFTNPIGTLPNTAVAIRDATYDALVGMPEFGGQVNLAATAPSKDSNIPALYILLNEEVMSTEFWGQSAPHFNHDVSLHISIIIPAGSELVLTGAVDELAEKVKTELLSNNDWVRSSEGVAMFRTRRIYPREGEPYLAEVRLEITCKLQSWWEPVIPYDFREIDIKRKLSETQTLGAPPGTWPTIFEDDIVIPQNGIATVKPYFSNVGNGSMIAALGEGALNGDYFIEFIDPITFTIDDPRGIRIDQSADTITIMFAPGSISMVPHDSFTITVTAAAN